MKKSIFILVTLVFSLTSCLQQETISTGDGTTTIVTSDNNTNGGNGNTTGSTGTTGTTGSTNGSTGTTGSTGGTPPFEYEIMMAGDKTIGGYIEYPWNVDVKSSNGALGFFFGNTTQAIRFFASDSRAKVRFKVLPQPNPPTGSIYCKGRATGQSADQYKYTKLKFIVFLRDIICTSRVNGECVSSKLGDRYRSKTIGPVDVGSFSEVYNYSYIRNIAPNIEATSVEVAYVTSDSTCQANGSECPSEDKVRNASCWNMTMQVSTDYTDDF